MCGVVMYVHSCRDKQMNIIVRLTGIYNDNLFSIYNGSTVTIDRLQDCMINNSIMIVTTGGGHDDNDDDDDVDNNDDINRSGENKQL